MFTAYTNMSLFFLHRAFYLDKSNLPPSSAPKAAFIDKVFTITQSAGTHGKSVI